MTTMEGKTEFFSDGYKAGFQGTRDKSEMYLQNWGSRAAEEYAAGFRTGDEAIERALARVEF